MFRIKTTHLLVLPLLGLLPAQSLVAEAHYCVAVDGGFGSGGTTFIGSGFALPPVGNCTPWSGFTKTASSVILTTTGTGCLSSDGKVLAVSVLNADPSFFGTGQTRADYIRLSRSSTSVGFWHRSRHRLLHWKRKSGDLHEHVVASAGHARLIVQVECFCARLVRS